VPTLRFTKIEITGEFASTQECAEVVRAAFHGAGMVATHVLPEPAVPAALPAASNNGHGEEKPRRQYRRKAVAAPTPEPEEEPVIEAPMSVTDAILHALGSGPMTLGEICDRVVGNPRVRPTTRDTISSLLFQQHKKGTVAKTDDGWKLTAKPKR